MNKIRQPFFKNFMMILLVLCALGIFFGINSIYPLCSDDYSYSYCWHSPDNKVSDIIDVIHSQQTHYNTWGGRFIAHGIAQTFLMFDKTWFNIANTICYGLCTLLISLFACRRFSLSSWLVILLSFWLIMPHPGSSIFWLTGSCNYLWAACLCIAYIYLLFTDNVKYQYFSLILAIPAGNSHEGIALGVFVCTCMYAFLTKKRNPLFIISATIFLVGMLSNCFAPGNFVRLDGRNVATCFPFFTFAKSCIGEFLYVMRETDDWGLLFCGGAFVISIIWTAKLLYSHIHAGQSFPSKELSLLPAAAVTFALCVYTHSLYPRALFGFCFISYVVLYCLLSRLNYKYINLTLIVITFILSGVEITKMAQSVSDLKAFISYVSSEARKKNIILSTSSWKKAKQSRYIERFGMGECCIKNGGFEKYHRTLPFCVLDINEYNELIPHLTNFNKSNKGDFVRIGKDSYFCIGHRPKKVTSITLINGKERKVELSILCLQNKYFVLIPKNGFSIEVSHDDGTCSRLSLSSVEAA